MNSLTCSPAVAADIWKFRAMNDPKLGPFQNLHFNVDGSAIAMFQFGCLSFDPDGQPARHREPVGKH